MSLPAGTRLGPYEIAAWIGAGGMGEVYRATDSNLKRSVAIKVLPATLAGNPDRLARFQREAEVLAVLNHPNIATIYGLEKAPDVTALVMELVEGEDLSQRIARGAIPIEDALPIARQIAEALEAAHEQGIVHRDLKPANVKLRTDGTVKVLDFGLAKAMDPNVPRSFSPGGGAGPAGTAVLPNSPTLTSPAETAVGVIRGTAAYLSPEQAKGRAVDKRADIWAFGVVLYEMLSGRRAFRGDDVSDLLVAVLTKEVDFKALPAATPHAIVSLIRRCLVRDPRNRLRDIGDARQTLESGATAGPDEAPAARRSPWRDMAPWAVAAGLAVALALSLARAFERAPEALPVRRFTFAVPARSAPNWFDFDVALSNDGRHLAYNCRDGNTVSICVQALDSLTVKRVAEGRDAVEWVFSPDGEWLAIADIQGLSKVSIRGGRPQPIVRWSDEDQPILAFSWGSDNHILFGGRAGLRRVAASGGRTEPVMRVAKDARISGYTDPSILPDGRTALVTIIHVEGPTAGLVNLGDGSVRDLGIRGHGFVYLPQGWLAFKQGTTAFAVAFNPSDPTRLATPVPVIDNVGSRLRVARDGSLVYVPTRGESRARLVWVDRDGRATRAETQRLDYTHLALAPDGRRALLNLPGEINLIDLQNGTRKRLFGGQFPIWSPGDHVTFTGAGGLYRAPADGSGTPEKLVSEPAVVATSWNAVTGELAYYNHHAFEIWIRSPDGKTRRFLGAPGRKRSGRFSADGKWMAFISDETGEYQVYVTAYPGPGPVVPVSTNGGLSPIWSGDGRELFFRLGEKVMAARMTSRSPPVFAAPVELFDGPYTLDLQGHQREDVATDGKRFLMVENSDDFPIVFVQNWAEELNRRLRRK